LSQVEGLALEKLWTDARSLMESLMYDEMKRIGIEACMHGYRDVANPYV
jgi:hypothetical protein